MQLIRWLIASRSCQCNWPIFCAKALLLNALILPVPAWSSDVSQLPVILQKKVEEVRNACAEFNNGEFELEWESVQRVDLDGDLHSDWVLNDFGFACSTAASLYCGTGGCMSHFLIEEHVASLLNQGWEIATIGSSRVLVAEVHGSQCDGIGPTPCVVASVWDGDEKKWRSADAEWE